MEDSRDYVLMDQINNLYDLLNKEELEVAYAVINIIAIHLNKKHFREKDVINVRALVKTFEELDKIGLNKFEKMNSAK
jgi:hypothetical protein